MGGEGGGDCGGIGKNKQAGPLAKSSGLVVFGMRGREAGKGG